MCGVPESADHAALDMRDEASGISLDVNRGRGPARESSYTGLGKTIAVIVLTVMLVCAGSYLALRGRTKVKTPAAVHSVGATSSQPNTPKPVAPMNGTGASPVEGEDFRSAEPRPGGNPTTEENDDPEELWSRVRQGDTGAEVSLAKLYLRGNAPGQNCEQAHVLLLAASRKQSKVADSLLGGAYKQQCQ
jgi:hypothetical protein